MSVLKSTGPLRRIPRPLSFCQGDHPPKKRRKFPLGVPFKPDQTGWYPRKKKAKIERNNPKKKNKETKQTQESSHPFEASFTCEAHTAPPSNWPSPSAWGRTSGARSLPAECCAQEGSPGEARPIFWRFGGGGGGRSPARWSLPQIEALLWMVAKSSSHHRSDT